MTRRPETAVRVGITARLARGDAHALGARRKDLLGAESGLVNSVCEAGALPLVLPWPRGLDAAVARHRAHAAADAIDALIVQGGADVAPELFGEKPLRPEWAGDADRDRYEIALVERVLAQGKPVLGICRGCQLLNVVFGGSLHQDLILQREGSIVHSNPVVYEAHTHAVRLASGGLVATLHGRERGDVASAHHQGIARLGAGLVAEAWCDDDDLIEAVRTDAGWAVGVQWHPELHADDAALLDRLPLFAALVARAAA
jgi:putative glutamine amidotransferase